VSVARIPRGHSYEYCLRIAVYNTNPQILREIRRGWGGHLSRVASRRDGWKPGYQLIWTNAAAAMLVSEIEPHLRLKTAQARLMVQFQREVQKTRRKRNSLGRLLPLSARERAVREDFYRRLKRLNRTGPRKASRDQRDFSQGHTSRVIRAISPEYLAGFIDGEGSLMLSKARRVIRQDSAYVARLSIDNTYKSVLEEIQRDYGGGLFEQTPQKVGWSRSYKLLWTGCKVEGPLRLVAPYLRVKRSRARTLIRFIEHKRRTEHGRGGRWSVPPPNWVIAYREALFRRMRVLNSKGLLSQG
jgi:hypothetical protein